MLPHESSVSTAAIAQCRRQQGKARAAPVSCLFKLTITAATATATPLQSQQLQQSLTTTAATATPYNHSSYSNPLPPQQLQQPPTTATILPLISHIPVVYPTHALSAITFLFLHPSQSPHQSPPQSHPQPPPRSPLCFTPSLLRCASMCRAAIVGRAIRGGELCYQVRDA